MFTQVVHQFILINSFVDKVWLLSPAVLQDKPVLFMKFSADFSVMFVLVEEMKLVSCSKKLIFYIF